MSSLRFRVTLSGLLGLAVVLSPALGETAGFDDSQQLTAVDLVVGFDQTPFDDWATDPAPLFPDPEDFGLLVDGLRHPVLSVGSEEPWDVVVYFVTERSRTAFLRRSANELADRADQLSLLGPVRIVVADPEPGLSLPAELSPSAVRARLGELAQSLIGKDEIVGLRDEVRQELKRIENGEGTAGMSPEELARAAIDEEIQIVRSAHDRLLAWLTAQASESPRRLLVLVAGSYDLTPEASWSDVLPGVDLPTLETASADLDQVLASYGWTVLAVHPEPEKPLRDGWTIGKWRFDRFDGAIQNHWDPKRNEEVPSTFLGWTFRHESHRKPERAEAYLELGASQLEGDDLEEAVGSFQKSLYHFAGHQKTADRQAFALLSLGEALRRLDDAQEAREAFRLSRLLDAAAAEKALGPPPELLSPLSPLHRLLEATGGRLAAGRDELSRVLEELRHRLRVTYQVTGVPDGRTVPVEVELFGPWRDPVHPRWARRSTPEALAAARLRLALEGKFPSPPLDLQLRMTEEGELALHLDLHPLHRSSSPPPEETEKLRIRVSQAVVSPDVGDFSIRHSLRDPEPLPTSGIWTDKTTLEIPADGAGAILVEDLLSGLWGLVSFAD